VPTEYFVVKSVQLYLEGLKNKDIATILNTSEKNISRWLKPYRPLLKIIRLDKHQIRDFNIDVLTIADIKTHFDGPVSGIVVDRNNIRNSRIWGVVRDTKYQ
jgi:predicted transcriptional regulator